ncbi:DEAD/DEAH box helicase [Bradyrhizobium sp. LHD-71]|uniref:DEAD/DEAH box helicase n=1 Tax=Bradyrhizobium sp. LHD-71 TaxID=3072141 RepID=UPI00280EFF0C|nr:DEAD/DEAH box helicase [Bradyrhizobium sp. LHD-71]MDQ8730680.1 DEAD/DEAH box helicase [Bradyrhizobium sp. LHD-71]
MIDALIERVWSNPALSAALATLEKNWIARSAGIEAPSPGIEANSVRRYVEAAAILACSERTDQRLAAYRIATYAHELFRDQLDGLDAAVRAVLTRLGNFPGIATTVSIASALERSPWAIAGEELRRRSGNEVPIGGQMLALTDFQKALWNSLTTGGSLAISAPTSTGKSFVLQAFISKEFATRPGFSACYVVPTRALIAQVHTDLSMALLHAGAGQVEVVTVPPEEDEVLPEKAAFVLTQERLQILLKNHPQKSMNFLVIDEAHSIQDGDRGIILQTAIDELLARNPATQLLFASPTVSNLNVFGEMTGRLDVVPQSTDQLAVSQNFIDVEVTSASRGDVKIFARDGASRREVGAIRIGQTLASRVDCLVHVAHRFGSEKQSIVFADGQADAEKLAIQISELRSMDGKHEPSAALQELSELAKEAVHPKYSMAMTAQNGVGFHYGNIPTILRNAVEQAFISGDLRYLVCTSTLLAGVNLPAQNIFMHSPHRKKGVALDSIDFWNLSGRAGRLRKEFQGNIYLINYEKWDAQPLSGPRLCEIVPAIKSTINAKMEDLEAVIVGSRTAPRGSDSGLDTVFVRLLSDFKSGRIQATLDRADITVNRPERKRLEDALSQADKVVTLPPEVLSSSPTISAHRQQQLFSIFAEAISVRGERAAREFLLAHPRETDAFASYVNALSLCHRTILPKRGSDRQNRFFATMLLKWMQGISIPELVEDRIRFNRDASIATSIRGTLDLVETELRFNYVRTFGCYSAVLAEALRAAGLADLLRSLPSIPLYLEVGASDKTMISLISLGLSRLAAKRLTNICPVKTYNVVDARAWLGRQDLEILGFSSHIKREVERVLSSRSIAS